MALDRCAELRLAEDYRRNLVAARGSGGGLGSMRGSDDIPSVNLIPWISFCNWLAIFLCAFDKLEDHGMRRPVRQAAFDRLGAMPDGRKGAFNGIRRL